MAESQLNIQLHPKQMVALHSKATEIMYGGAAGGGKSHLMRVAAIVWCSMIPGLQAYLFRRTFPELQKTHMEGPQSFRVLLAPWVTAGLVTIVANEIRFVFNGSRIFLCHLNTPRAIDKYLSADIHALLIDEATTFQESEYRFLRSRVRAVGLNLPPALAEQFPRILGGTNPGNVGHTFVKQSFIDGRAPLEVTREPRSEGGMLRQFIPARLEDNLSMMRDDPSYEQRLEGLGDPILIKAMRFGEWNIAAGAFFGYTWDSDVHLVNPLGKLPDGWRFRYGFDWGYAKPAACEFFAMSDGSPLRDGRVYPPGSMIGIGELYTAARTPDGRPKANEGARLSNYDLGVQLASLAKDRYWSGNVADPTVFNEDGGKSIYDQMQAGAHDAGENLTMFPAVTDRVNGWQTMFNMLNNALEPKPEGPVLAFVRGACPAIERTIGTVPRSLVRIEDLETKSEDHALDATRYAVMGGASEAESVDLQR